MRGLLPSPMPRAHPAPPAPPPRDRRAALVALALVAATLLAYANSFGVPFVFDDEPSILENPTLRRLADAWWPPADGGLTVSGRPLLNLTLALNWAAGGANPAGYHLVNVLIHAVNGLLLFSLLRHTLRSPPLRARFGDAATALAGVAAALWLLHPLQTESVTYVIQRAESLVALCYLLTFWCFVRSVAAARPAGWHAATVGACLLGMTAKEVMVTAPVLLALYDRTFHTPDWRELWHRRRGLYLALAATWLPLAGLVWSTAGRGGTAGFGSAVSSADYALTQVHAVVHYLRLAIWPHPLVLDYGTAVIRDARDVIWPALVLAPLAGLALWLGGRARPAGFALLFFFGVLAPSSSLVPVATQTMAEHRAYLPLAGLAALAATAAWTRLGRTGLATLTALAAGLGVLTFLRNADYRTPIALYEDTLAKVPANARARARLADYYVRAGRLEDARRELERSVELEPQVPEAWNNLGNVWQRLDQPDRAIEAYRRALAIRPDDPTTLNNLGNSLIYRGRIEEGLTMLRTALRLAPNSLDARYNLGNTLAQIGRLPEAAVELSLLVGQHPSDADSRARYGDVLAALGRLPEAVAELQRATELAPANADFQDQLGIALARTGRLREALACFERALQLAPTHPTARQNASLVRERLRPSP